MRAIRQSKRLSLSDILFCDGTIYFVVLFMLNVLHLVFSLTAVSCPVVASYRSAHDDTHNFLQQVLADSGGSYLSVFTSPVTAILVSRFLLELQEANQTVVRLDPDDPLHSSRHSEYDDTPRYLSSLGAFIHPDLPAPSDDDSESHFGSHAAGEEADAMRAAASESSSSV
ncbi:hypothetical protein C8T65DRAFT_646740 [Cerioporus squamosus]|nr:hypothetical protein C8T65DRAFT_646740 [Cerioporus squamosus]